MNFIKPFIAASLALLAAQARADIPVFSEVAASPGTYGAPASFMTFSLPSQVFVVQPGQNGNWSQTPLDDTGSYLAVMNGGIATIALNGAHSFSFLWGSPDQNNLITIDGITWSGAQLLSGGNAVYATFTSASGMQDITFADPGTAFEIAVGTPDSALPVITAVPEPNAYALILAGLGAIAFVAHRQRR